MKINIVIQSEQLTKEDLQVLLQGIRDCEHRCFRDKTISIAVFVPELASYDQLGGPQAVSA